MKRLSIYSLMLMFVLSICSCNPIPTVSEIILNSKNLSLMIGDTFTLTASVKPDDATDKTVVWKSSDNNVATVTDGVVKAIDEGNAIITASCADGRVTATCSVTVTRIKVVSVTLSKKSLTMHIDETATLTATVAPSNASYKEIEWSSDNPAVVKVSDGTLTALNIGTANISAKAGDISAICPVTVKANLYLTFSSEGETTLSLSNNGDNAPILYYSTDKQNWTRWDYSGITFTRDMPLFIYGDNPKGFSNDTGNYSTFTATGDKFGVSGDIMSLIDRDDKVNKIPGDACFYALFKGCSGLTKAPELTATTLGHDCYSNMFQGCTSLILPPALPATSFWAQDKYGGTFGLMRCYDGMFSGCINLTIAPELPALEVGSQCYAFMFQDCKSLTIAPDLPATILYDGCYMGMFSGCTSLTKAPELPATQLNHSCYANMFDSCTSLTQAPMLPATTLASNCYMAMFQFCTNLTAAPELPAPILEEGCYMAMFNGCKTLCYVKCLATDISANNCIDYEMREGYYVGSWLYDVANTGTFVKAASMNDWPSGERGIPNGWTVIDAE